VKRILALLACLAVTPAWPVEGAVWERPMCDPCRPPQAKRESPEMPATEGAALRAQVERKLRADFEAAATGGALTREQATAAGLGFIASHYGEIDRGGRGSIRFEDYKRFLKSRGAALE
jgi:hypothetical protein